MAEAEKRAALGRITASVADKIRTPLTAVGGFVRRLDKKISEGKRILVDHQGWIQVESTVGSGARFVLYFPAAAE